MRPRAFPGLALLAAGLAGGAGAQTQVISPRADAVSVTIYRDLFALITETRTVELPEGPVTLSFDGVVETLIPASAVVSELDRTLEERNYDYDRLAPASLLRKSIGKRVVLTRTLPGSGKVTRTPATIVAADDAGVTLHSADGLEALSCSGLPEGLTFEEIPADLHPKPRLSVTLAAGTPGRRTVKLSYLAQGFAWSSDYVARLAADGRSFDLTGWATLRNLTRASLKQAEVQLVAGRLNLLHEEDGGSSTIGATADFGSETELQDARNSRLYDLHGEEEEIAEDLEFLHGCYPHAMNQPRPLRDKYSRSRHFGTLVAEDTGGELEEVIVTGLRGSLLPPEALADYHLYRVPWPTDLQARQTKQAVFLQKSQVKAEQFYSFRVTAELFDEPEPALRAQRVLQFENTRSAGLGEPLPSGMFRAFVPDETGDIFLGAARFGDKAVGVPAELELAGALDLMLEASYEEHPDEEFTDVMLRITNAKDHPVTVEIRQEMPEDIPLRIERANHRTGRKFGDYLWRLKLAAHSVDTLTYRVREQE